jgi:ribokinase
VTRVAVVGHTEWATFARVPAMPVAGAVTHASEVWEEPGGGGAVAAAHLAGMAGACAFFTALGDDPLGDRTVVELAAAGVEVLASRHAREHRRVLVHVEAAGERAITVLGDRLWPAAADPLPWDRLAGSDGVYFTGGDAGAVRAARAARVLVATARPGAALVAARVRLDALVRSAADPGERLDPAALEPRPPLVVTTEGASGGRWEAADGTSGRWAPSPPPGPPVDAYGCGDAFAAGLTYALTLGRRAQDAVDFAARLGAACLTRRGGYPGPGSIPVG